MFAVECHAGGRYFVTQIGSRSVCWPIVKRFRRRRIQSARSLTIPSYVLSRGNLLFINSTGPQNRIFLIGARDFASFRIPRWHASIRAFTSAGPAIGTFYQLKKSLFRRHVERARARARTRDITNSNELSWSNFY